EKVKDEVDEVRKEGAKPRPANRFDVAVHMPWTKFREGEPIPAYFVLRNNRGAILGLRSRIDCSGSHPQMHGSGISYAVRDRATGKSVVYFSNHVTNCGGGSLVDVPADGFDVEKADLSRVSEKLLPAGDYEVEWEYYPYRSAPVRFSVL